jgi:hypothetical protein
MMIGRPVFGMVSSFTHQCLVITAVTYRDWVEADHPRRENIAEAEHFWTISA